ncbi:MAG: hypothetical protein QM737_01560 [Ferruginibacter sp.]
MYAKIKVPATLWVVVFLALVFTFLHSPNLEISIPVFLYLPFVYYLFFIKGDPNIIFWGLLYQWLSVSTQLIYCTILGEPVSYLFVGTIFPAELMEYTNMLSIIGIYAFTLGVFFAVRKVKIIVPDSAWDKYEPRKILQVYVLVSLFINTFQFIIWAFPNLVQYFFFFFYIKWGFFVVAFISIFKRAPDLKIFLYVIVAIEFILGLSSFFASNFANILLFSVISFSAINKRITYARGVLFVIAGLVLFHMAVLWTASKTSYRTYLKKGEMSQSVSVSREEARAKLLELIVEVDDVTYESAIEELVNRVGYVHYFAAAVRFVPARIPYENGALYLAAVDHFLVPRFINPDKEILDDSKHTNKYTGLNLSGKSKATSFSLGSFADAYIDMGPYLMYIPIFLFGFLIGFFFKYLYRPNLWGMIVTAPFFLLINIYGIDTIKALGFILIYFLVIAVVKRQLMKTIDPMMLKSTE